MVDCIWNVMAHAQKPDFFFRRKERVHLNWQGSQCSRLLAAEVCASALVMVVMLDTPRSDVVWSRSICQFPLHFPSRASPCAITFQLDSTCLVSCSVVWSWGSDWLVKGLSGRITIIFEAWINLSSILCVVRYNPYSTAFPYGNGMVLHFYQQQESSTTKTVHKVINKGLKTYV